MKGIISTLKSISKSLLKTELESIAGRVNLIGGIILTLLVGGIFIDDVVKIILNSILSFFGKINIPSMGNGYILAGIFFVGLYFYLCVRTIIELKEVDK